MGKNNDLEIRNLKLKLQIRQSLVFSYYKREMLNYSELVLFPWSVKLFRLYYLLIHKNIKKMRLTAELIYKSSQYLNAIDDYHLNLRGIFYSKICF